MKYWLPIAAALLALPLGVQAGQVQVAVAANFAAPMQKIAPMFEAHSGHKAVLSFGATGKFYAQITHGAPFDVLLAADAETPARLQQEKQGTGRFTYAIGKLALWSKDPALVDGKGAILHSAGIQRLAIADPKLAPYGAAAIETLTRLGRVAALRPTLVQGESISQTYQFVASGNAPLGFVALSQIWANNKLKEGSAWIVPSNLHRPIRQDALLLNHGKDNAAARALLEYLQSAPARAVIQSFGYDL